MFYPDVSVVCGPKETSIKDPRAIINPILVLEVLSESTRDLDYGSKVLTYRQLASLQGYVLADQDAARVDVYSRTREGWTLRSFDGWDSVVELPHLGGTIAMSDIYRMVEGVDPNSPTAPTT